MTNINLGCLQSKELYFPRDKTSERRRGRGRKEKEGEHKMERKEILDWGG